MLLRVVLTILVLSPILAEELLQPGDFEYKGAFRLPHGDQEGGSSFLFGGHAGCLGPAGKSLYLLGHPYQELVAEVSLPEPAISPTKRWQDLPVAAMVTSFKDPATAATRAATKIPPTNADTWGLLVHDGALLWSLFQFYNVGPEDHPFIGRAPLLNAVERPGEGPWWPGAAPIYRSHGALFRVPTKIADAHFGGRSIGIGGHKEGTPANVSHGPSCFVFHAPAMGTPANAKGDALELVFYPSDKKSPQFAPCDAWNAAAWIERGTKSALVFCGRKSNPAYRYGEPVAGSCMGAKGFHCDPYRPTFLMIDPQELVQVADGARKPHEVRWYVEWHLDDTPHLWPNCYGQIGPMAFNDTTGLLYLVQPGGYSLDKSSPYPLVHVWSVKGGIPPPPDQPPAPPPSAEQLRILELEESLRQMRAIADKALEPKP